MSAPGTTFTENDESTLKVAKGATFLVIGPASKGAFQSDVLISSIGQMLRMIGAEIAGHNSIDTVRQIINAGGKVRFARSVHLTNVADFSTRTSVPATITLKDGSAVDTMTLDATEEGDWANGITVVIAAASNGDTEAFKMTISGVSALGIPAEVFDNIKIVDIPSLVSNNYTFTDENSITAPPGDRPANGSFIFASGDNGVAAMSDITKFGGLGAQTGIYGVRTWDFIDAFCPDCDDNAVHLVFKALAEQSPNRFVANLAFPANITAAVAVTFRDGTGAYAANTRINSSFAAMHYGEPKFVAADSAVGASEYYGSDGAFGGILSNNDTVRSSSLNEPGAHLTPSGRLRGQSKAALGLRTDMAGDSAGRDAFADASVNWFQLDSGIVTHHGNYTLLDDKTKLTQFLNVRRMLLALEDKLTPAMEEALYEPNDPILWRATYRKLKPILDDEVSKRALYDFQLDCDQNITDPAEANFNTPDVVSAGQFKIQLRVKPIPGALFITLNVYVDDAGVVYTDA